MGLFSKIFNRKSSISQNDKKQYLERDNKGTRHQTLSFASSYWTARNVTQKFDPFVLYVFDHEEDAKQALLELPCIKIAEDTNNIICTETLIFGYYKLDNGKTEAIICGDDLSIDIWETATKSFQKHGGVKKNEKKPEKTQQSNALSKSGDSNKVKFIREDKQQTMGQTCIYRVHKGPDAACAKAFLDINPVTKPLYFLVVETPDGNYCRDKNGMYKE